MFFNKFKLTFCLTLTTGGNKGFKKIDFQSAEISRNTTKNKKNKIKMNRESVQLKMFHSYYLKIKPNDYRN